MQKQNRQGDIFFQTVANLPKNLKKLNSNILAYGEVTGHSHAVLNMNDVDEAWLDETTGSIYLKGSDIIKVSHDEHDTISLDSGDIWEVTRQREYDPIMEMQRVVAD